MNRSLTFRTVLFASFFLAAAVPLAVVGTVASRSLYAQGRENLEAQNLVLARAVRGEVRALLQQPATVLDMVASVAFAPPLHDQIPVDRVLRRVVRAFPYFESIFCLGKDGRIEHLGLSGPLAGKEADYLGMDLSGQTFFREGFPGGRGRWSDTFLSVTAGQVSVTYALPIRDGVLAGVFSVGRLADLVGRVRLTGRLDVWILDRTGTVIFHPDETVAARRTNLANLEPVRAALDGNEGTWLFPLGARRFLGSAVRIPETGWVVLVTEDARFAFGPITRLQQVFAGATLAAVAVALLAATLLARRVVRPLGGLEATAARMAAGEYDAPVPDSPLAEIRHLADGFRAMARAVRERERALETSRSRYLQLFNGGTDAVFVHPMGSPDDPWGRFVEVNDGACVLLGRPREELLGLRPQQTVAHRSDQRVADAYRTLAQVGSARFETALRARDGEEIPVEIAARVFDLDGEPMILAHVRDLRERKRAERERAALEEKVRQAQKLESLGVLAGGIAHDFNNLLMGVLGNADLALGKLPPGSPARPNVEAVVTAAERAAELTNQMLAYSGRGNFVVERLDLSGLVRETAHLLRTAISKKAVLRFDLQNGLSAIQADPTQVRQVVMNLITNASDALEGEDGVIWVRTGQVEADRSCLGAGPEYGDLSPGRYAYVEVEDNGCGMDADTRERLFDPFFTTKFTGRGLGLAAVLGIVRGHRGAIRLDSEPGRGTTFRVLFPVSDGPLAGQAPTDDAVGEPTGEAVLVVDDDPSVLEVAGAMLRAHGYRVFTAADGREGVRLFREKASDISAVILDLTMPRMGGEDAFREIHRIRPDTPVILASGYTETDATGRLGGLGIAGFIQKPFRVADLLAVVGRALSRERRSPG